MYLHFWCPSWLTFILQRLLVFLTAAIDPQENDHGSRISRWGPAISANRPVGTIILTSCRTCNPCPLSHSQKLFDISSSRSMSLNFSQFAKMARNFAISVLGWWTLLTNIDFDFVNGWKGYELKHLLWYWKTCDMLIVLDSSQQSQLTSIYYH